MRTNNPLRDATRYLESCDRYEMLLEQAQSDVDWNDDDYAEAMADADHSDLIMVCLNNPNVIGSTLWIRDVIKQAHIDMAWLKQRAEEIKNDRVEANFDPLEAA